MPTPLAAAQQWWAFSHSSVDPKASPKFFQFLSLWIGFNALYSAGGNESAAVRRFADTDLRKHHLQLMQGNEAYMQAVKYLKDRPVRNMRTGKLVDLTNVNEVGQVADCLYAIRCNLFHGDKEPNDFRDQTVVDCASTILSDLLNAYFADEHNRALTP
ncbi:MAG: hypothetical protein ABSD63_08400 [Candidatus Korobacteraceae bacterium]|jgi:hypothetical protein